MVALSDQAGTVRAGEELDIARLQPFLREHLGNTGPVTVEQFPGGHSNLTYLVRLGNRELILRRPPFGSKVRAAHDMAREFRVLSKLHTAYPLAPKAILYCDDPSILNAPFYLMEPIRGLIIRRDPPPGVPFPPETARRLSEAFIDNLARLHGLDYAAIGLADLGKPQGYLERQVKGWIERYHNSKTHDLPEVERISPWLLARMPATHESALIHNDYKYDNLVLDPNDPTKIVGVLDWEMCTIGDPLTDMGTALAYWTDAHDPEDFQEIRSAPTNLPGALTRAQLVERYAGATNRDPGDTIFYLAFARFKVAVIIQQIYYRYAQGLTQDERFAVLPQRIHTLMRASWLTAESETI
ncbi:MAG TPA: phosphotransferase family protein [Terriglobales bacterium]|jgi:aminoglycoside phosphotransferase (APT) family kinase protein|nr:phosphotransferase family protein [Terriglobales bacterium]